jgi:WD40 repeat protein
MDLKFSPTSNVLALSQVTGAVRIYSYNDQETKEQMVFNYHTDSVRAVEFSNDGNVIYTGSKDQSLAVITNGQMAGRIMDAHDAPISTVHHMDSGNVIASGDDDGMIRIWDLRQAQKSKKHAIVMEFKEHEGTVNQLVFNKEANQIVSVSNDGHLGVFDLRKKELYAMSDNFEEDLPTVTLMKEGRKVLAASADGVINIFSWDFFGDCNDRITGHPGCIDTMIQYDEDIVITGCEDGLIRAVSVLPNKIVAILGDPLDTDDEVFHI